MVRLLGPEIAPVTLKFIITFKSCFAFLSNTSYSEGMIKAAGV